MRANIQQHVHSIAGADTPATGVELAALIRMIANQYESLNAASLEEGELSRARWGILFRLLGEARQGNAEGVSPTFLSQCINVSKNTISTLLRGLETQGLIQRILDPEDRRRFRIQLTTAGRDLVEASAPERILLLNQVLDALAPAEQQQLLTLLTKLHQALAAQTLAAQTLAAQTGAHSAAVHENLVNG